MSDTMYCYSRNLVHSSKHATTILVGYLSVIIKFAFNILSDINNNKKSIKYSTSISMFDKSRWASSAKNSCYRSRTKKV